MYELTNEEFEQIKDKPFVEVTEMLDAGKIGK